MNNKYSHQIALTVPQVAEVLGGLSHGYVYRIIREKKLPSKKIGGRVLVSRQALEKFLNTPDEIHEDDEVELNVTELFSPGLFNSKR